MQKRGKFGKLVKTYRQLRVGTRAMILKSETYHFHRLDLTRQAGFIATVYDEDGLRLAATPPFPTPEQAFAEARKIVDNKIEGPKNSLLPEPD